MYDGHAVHATGAIVNAGPFYRQPYTVKERMILSQAQTNRLSRELNSSPLPIY